MKKWSIAEILLLVFGLTVCSCLLIYFVGMFALKQATNEANLPLRQKIVDLMSFIAAQILAIIYIIVNGKDNKNDNNLNK